MVRYVVPVLFLVVSGAVYSYNSQHTASQYVFPGLHMIPGYESMHAQGQLSWQLLAGAATVFLLWAFVDQIREIRRRREIEPE